MRVLFISTELIGSALCLKLVEEGHSVRLYIKDEGRKRCLDGFVAKTDSWKKELKWVGKKGLIVFDDVGYGKEQDRLRKEGFRVVGGSGGGDLLEIRREHFQKVLKQFGIPYLPTKRFLSHSRAIAFIEKNPGRWVLKQSTHESSLNIVGRNADGSDIIEKLKIYKAADISPVYLQQYVSGIEVGIARYFNGTDWVGPIEINHEFKHYLDGEHGPLTSEMGTVMWYSDDETLPLFSRTLAKLKPHLQKIDFRGDIDINCILNKDACYPLEATARFGTPATELQCELNISPWGEFLKAVADGTPFDFAYKNEYGLVATITVPPFPYIPSLSQRITPSDKAQTKIIFDKKLKKSELKHIYFEEVARLAHSSPELHWVGDHGQVLHVASSAATIAQAKKKVYNMIKYINIPQMFYRKDIGDRVRKSELATLSKWNWI